MPDFGHERVGMEAGERTERSLISSQMTTSGFMFWTASSSTSCCSSRRGTIRRRLQPMHGCGTTASPAISLLRAGVASCELLRGLRQVGGRLVGCCPITSQASPCPLSPQSRCR
jgi:hypothetical protein